MNALIQSNPLPGSRTTPRVTARTFLPVSILLLLIGLWTVPARAEGPKYRTHKGTPSANVQEMKNLIVKSAQVHENFLFLDDQRYLVTPQSRCINERGKRISWKRLPESGAFDLRYQTRSRDEESPYGSREKVLLELRVLSPPKHEGSSR